MLHHLRALYTTTVRIVNMIRDNVVPQPNLRIENCQLNGKRVLALFVDEGDLPPYGLDPAKPKILRSARGNNLSGNSSRSSRLCEKT